MLNVIRSYKGDSGASSAHALLALAYIRAGSAKDLEAEGYIVDDGFDPYAAGHQGIANAVCGMGYAPARYAGY